MMAMTPADRNRIRDRLKRRWRGLVKALAVEFGVSVRTIHRISTDHQYGQRRRGDVMLSELGLQPGSGKVCRKCGERLDPAGYMTATGLHVECELREQARQGRIVIAEVKSV